VVLLAALDQYRGPRAWFCVADAAVQVLLGVAGAAAEFTAYDGIASCAVTAWATVAVAGAYFAALVAARPHRTPTDFHAVVFFNILVLAVAAAMALVVQRATNKGVKPNSTTLLLLAAVGQCIAFVQAVYDLTPQIVDLIVAWRAGALSRLLLRAQLRRERALRALLLHRTSSSRAAPAGVVTKEGGEATRHNLPRDATTPPYAPLEVQRHPTPTEQRPLLRVPAAVLPTPSSRHNETFSLFVDLTLLRDGDADTSFTDTTSASSSVLDQEERLMQLLL
jgi:hypothetical protein